MTLMQREPMISIAAANWKKSTNSIQSTTVNVPNNIRIVPLEESKRMSEMMRAAAIVSDMCGHGPAKVSPESMEGHHLVAIAETPALVMVAAAKRLISKAIARRESSEPAIDAAARRKSEPTVPNSKSSPKKFIFPCAYNAEIHAITMSGTVAKGRRERGNTMIGRENMNTSPHEKNVIPSERAVRIPFWFSDPGPKKGRYNIGKSVITRG